MGWDNSVTQGSVIGAITDVSVAVSAQEVKDRLLIMLCTSQISEIPLTLLKVALQRVSLPARATIEPSVYSINSSLRGLSHECSRFVVNGMEQDLLHG